jgi:hypothetical protein
MGGNAPQYMSLAAIVGGLYCINEYRKNGEKGYLLFILIFSVAAVYMHPVGIYYGVAVAIYILYDFIFRNKKKAVHIGLILVLTALVIFPYGQQITSEKEGDVWDTFIRNKPNYVVISDLLSDHFNLLSILAVFGIIIGYRSINPVLTIFLLTVILGRALTNTPGGGWKMNMLIALPLSIFAGFFIVEAVKKIKYKKIQSPIYVLLIVIFLPTNLFFTQQYLTHPWNGIRQSESLVYEWIIQKTPQDAVFIFNKGDYGSYMVKARRSAYIFNSYLKQQGYEPGLIKERQDTVSKIMSGKQLKEAFLNACESTDRPTYVLMPKSIKNRNRLVENMEKESGIFTLYEVEGLNGKRIAAVECGKLVDFE